ncbi:MAG TPA: conjugal transfer protein TraF [Vicinamibacteria bacterium]|nr:conjugal transfer protein TraF [Vicinamibacteria bacterium]
MLRALWTVLLVPGIAAADDALLHYGPRAASLGGAFTAVAADSTAFYWNPAGYAFGPFVQAGVQGGETNLDRGYGFSVGYTFMGVAGTWLRQQISADDRDVTLDTFDLAFSILQSLPVDDLVVAANVHYLRGGIANEMTSSKANLDAGFLYQPDHWVRLGVMSRSLLEPSFRTSDGDELVVSRHTRAGVAFSLPRRTLVSLDVDVTRRGHGREISLGAEKEFLDGKIAVRAGVRGDWGEGEHRGAGWSLGLGGRIRWLLLDLAYLAENDHRDDSLWLGMTVAP